MSQASPPVLYLAPDGLDCDQIAATVVVLLLRKRAAQGPAGQQAGPGEPGRDRPQALRRLTPAPPFVPPHSWQAPSPTIPY